MKSSNTGKPTTRRCHFVPVFYLNHFVNIQTNKLWVRDLKEKKTFKASPRDVANLRDYYAGEKARHTDDLEQKLATIEGDAAAPLRALLNGGLESPAELPPEVTRFIAWLAARSEWVRKLPNNYKDSCSRGSTSFVKRNAFHKDENFHSLSARRPGNLLKCHSTNRFNIFKAPIGNGNLHKTNSWIWCVCRPASFKPSTSLICIGCG